MPLSKAQLGAIHEKDKQQGGSVPGLAGLPKTMGMKGIPMLKTPLPKPKKVNMGKIGTMASQLRKMNPSMKGA